MIHNEQIIRNQLVTLLRGEGAHMTLDEAIKNFPLEHINDIFPNGTYSSWHLLEHIRLTQNDILEFISSPNYHEKEWPKAYWPKKRKKALKNDWDITIKKIHDDVKTLETIVKNPKIDLSAKIPHGNGQTIIREILLVADHTAYHIGEFCIMRQVMNTWK